MSLVPQCIRLIGNYDFDRHGLQRSPVLLLFKTYQRLLRILQQYMWSGCQTVRSVWSRKRSEVDCYVCVKVERCGVTVC
jgi:hypothetical protein